MPDDDDDYIKDDEEFEHPPEENNDDSYDSDYDDDFDSDNSGAENNEDDDFSHPVEDEFPHDDHLDLTPEKDGSDLNNIDNISNEDIEIENEISQVASTPAKNILLLGALIIGAVLFLYNIVFKEDEETARQKEMAKIIESQPIEKAVEATQQEDKIQVDIGVVETPDLPDIEGLPALPPPTTFDTPEVELSEDTFGGFEPSPPEPEVVTPPPVQRTIEPAVEPVEIVQPEQPEEITVTGPSAAEIAARRAARRKSGMIVINGGGSPDTDDERIAAGDFLSVEKLGKTSSAQVAATRIGNTDIMIAQGKMIDAVLETAINTDLPGSLRAIVSRDVYAESGKSILIPKGSRLIGQYNNNISRGQVRVIVTWSRLIRPDGVDIAIDSPGTDQLGRAGMTGIVDNKLFDIITNSILVSAITVGGAIAIDGLNKSQGVTSSTTSGADGSSTSSTTANTVDFAVLEAVDDISSVAQDVAEGSLNEQPTIVVNQGARIKVFVNRDLVFPSSAIGSVNFVN